MLRLEQKLARIRADAYRRQDFIIADAKDPDMGPGLYAVGPARERDGSAHRFRTRWEFLDSIEAVDQAGRRRHHADLGLQPRKAHRARRFRRHGRQTRDPRERHDRYLAPSRRDISHSPFASVPNGLAREDARADRSRPLLDHVQQRSRRGPRIVAGVCRVSRRCGGARVQLFPGSLQSELPPTSAPRICRISSTMRS